MPKRLQPSRSPQDLARRNNENESVDRACQRRLGRRPKRTKAADNRVWHTYTFPLRAPVDFTAKVALASTASLYEFAALIIQTVGFDFDHAFEFCDHLTNPYRSKVRYTLFADIGEGQPGDLSVKTTRVQDVFRPRTRLGFHFDYGDDWMFLVRCDAIEPTTTKRKVRKVLTRAGTPPEQYPDCEEA